MSSYLQTQLKNAEEIKRILKEASVTFNLDDDRDVSTLLVYLPSKDGICSHTEFFDIVREGLLANFVLSCSEIEKKLGVENSESPEELFNKALRKLSKHTAQGELGELILFTLLDVYFKAPKILSKVSLKMHPKMPVFGADAVHGQFYDGEFRLYLGESKLYQDCKSASTSAAKSIESAKSKYIDEFDLLDSYIDFPNIDENIQSQLLAFLNPFQNDDFSKAIHSPCFIGFAEPDLISNAQSEQDFVDSYIRLANDYVQDFFNKIENQGLSIQEVSFLMLPFSSIDQLVEEFINYMGIER